MMIALQRKGYDIEYMDMRKEIDMNLSNYDEGVKGYIINEMMSKSGLMSKIGNMFSNRHWTCVRKINGDYWFLNSKERAPKRIGNKKCLEKFFGERRNKGDQICTIVKS